MSEATPAVADALVQIDALLERRRMPQARSLLERSLSAAPDHPELVLRAAWIESFEDRHDEAKRTLQQLLVHSPEHAGARELLFHVLLKLGELEPAEQLVLGLLREYPRSPGLYAAYATLMLRTFHFGKARELAREGLRLDPEDDDCLFALALSDVIESPRRAEESTLAELLRRHPENARSMALLAVSLQQRGRHRAALRIAEQLLRSQPNSTPYLALVRELRAVTHWSLLPLWPMMRWGWAGSALVWGGAVVALSVASRHPGPLSAAIVVVWISYVVYSWTWPSLLRRWLNRD